VLLLSTSATSAYCHVSSTELALCTQSNSTCSVRADCGGAAKFRRQWTDHLEQSVACTTSTRAVTEHLYTCTEDTPVLDRPIPLIHFYATPEPNTDALTDVLTYLLVKSCNKFGTHSNETKMIVSPLREMNQRHKNVRVETASHGMSGRFHPCMFVPLIRVSQFRRPRVHTGSTQKAPIHTALLKNHHSEK